MPSPSLVKAPRAALAIPRPRPAPERPWEGEFKARFRSGGSYIVPVKLVVQLRANMIEGKGRSLTYPRWGSDAERSFELTGTRQGAGLAFDLWFAASSVAHRPWSCDAALNAGGDVINGNWSMACLDPVDCDCGGPSGAFELKRCR